MNVHTNWKEAEKVPEEAEGTESIIIKSRHRHDEGWEGRK